jgi:hypothetical protein
MAFEAQLYGSLRFGNTDFDIGAVPDNKQNLLFKGAMRPGGRFALTALVKEAFSNTLSIDIGDSTLPNVTFTDISIEIDRERYASFFCQSQISWEKPFGIEVGFGLRSLTLYIKNPKSPNEAKIIRVGGKLFFGSKGSEVQLNTYCFFNGGSPVFVAVSQIPAINSLNDVIHQFFGDTISWPTNLIDLSLTNSSIYYLSDLKKLPDLSSFTEFLIDKNNVQQGFNISTTAGISLADTAPVNIALNIGITGANNSTNGGTKSPAGIKITAALTEPLDLIPNIIKFTGIDYTKGPVLQAQSYQNNSSFRFTCGVAFCGANFAAGMLDVTSDPAHNSKKLTGSYTTAAKLPAPFGNQKIEFTWTKPGGLIIKNLPFFATIIAAIDTLKYIQKFKKFVSDDNCGNIGELLFNRVIDTKFIITPSFATKFNGQTLTNPSGVYIIVDGYYKISVEGYQITSIKIPSIGFPIKAPKDFSFDGIIGFIETLIVDNIEAILKQLWDNKAELAKLLAVVMGKKALTEMVNKLVCEGLKQLLKSFLAALGDVAVDSVAAILAAAGGAVTTVVKTSGGGCGKSSDDDDDDSGSGGGGGGGGSDTPSQIRIANPKNVGAICVNDEIRITWERGDDHATGYEYQLMAFVPLSNPAKTAQMPIVDVIVNAYSGKIDIKQFSYKGVYTIKVKALANSDSNLINSNNVTVDLQKLAGPASVGSEYIKASQQIKATWKPDNQAMQYEVFIQKDGATIADKIIQKTADGKLATEAMFELSDLRWLSTGPFRIAVRSIGNNSQIPSEFVQTTSDLVISYGIGTMAIGTSFKIK